MKSYNWIKRFLLCSWARSLTGIIYWQTWGSLETFDIVCWDFWVEIDPCFVNWHLISIFSWSWSKVSLIIKSGWFSYLSTQRSSVFWVEITSSWVESWNIMVLSWSKMLKMGICIHFCVYLEDLRTLISSNRISENNYCKLCRIFLGLGSQYLILLKKFISYREKMSIHFFLFFLSRNHPFDRRSQEEVLLLCWSNQSCFHSQK